MKKWCLALLIIAAITGTAWGKSPSALDSLTKQNITDKLTTAATPHPDWSVSVQRTENNGNTQDTIHTLSNTTTVIASTDKYTGNVQHIVFLVSPNPNSTNEERARLLIQEILQSVETAARLVLPNFEEIAGLKEALNESIGPLNKALYTDVGKKHSMALNGIGVVLSAMFTDKGVYVLMLAPE